MSSKNEKNYEVIQAFFLKKSLGISINSGQEDKSLDSQIIKYVFPGIVIEKKLCVLVSDYTVHTLHSLYHMKSNEIE